MAHVEIVVKRHTVKKDAQCREYIQYKKQVFVQKLQLLSHRYIKSFSICKLFCWYISHIGDSFGFER